MNFRVKISTAFIILLLHFPVLGFSPLGGYGEVSVKNGLMTGNPLLHLRLMMGLCRNILMRRQFLIHAGLRGHFF